LGSVASAAFSRQYVSLLLACFNSDDALRVNIGQLILFCRNYFGIYRFVWYRRLLLPQAAVFKIPELGAIPERRGSPFFWAS
jgi:hypothetical protein